jgi:phosphopantetheinyl transferase
MGAVCERHEGKKHAYRALVRKPEGIGSLLKLRRSSEDNIKMDLKETECESMNRNHLSQDRDKWWTLLNTVMKSVSQNVAKLFTS